MLPLFLLFLLLLVSVAWLALRSLRLQRELRQVRADAAQFRLLAEHSVDIAWVLDAETLELVYLSPAAHSLTGYDLPALQNQISTLAQEVPARVQRWRNGDQSRVRLLREVELPHRDGRALVLEVTSTLVADVAGRPLTLLGSARDVSQAQRAEAEQETEQKRFASMLSHEFRTPLATIDGAVQRLVATADAAGADEATRKRYLKIQAAVDRLLGMINDYLSPERMAAIDRTRAADGVAPLALLQQAAATVPASHVVRLHLDEDLPAQLRCDVPGLLLCLKIVLDNAVKFSPSGSAIELEARLAPQGGVLLCVADRGVGLVEPELGQLFDKGFRGVHAGAHAGAGLGLYMAHAVVEVHGGNFQVSQRTGGGAEFRIWLPMAVAESKNLAAAEGERDNSLT